MLDRDAAVSRGPLERCVYRALSGMHKLMFGAVQVYRLSA